MTVAAPDAPPSVAVLPRRPDRTALVVTISALVVVVLVCVGMSIGDYVLDPVELLLALLRLGPEFDSTVIYTYRLPPILLGLGVGVALGLAGGLFQSALRNPLAAPDVIGVSGGAAVAALIALLPLGGAPALVSAFAFGGASIVAVVIGALSWRSGFSGYRFVVIGIAIAFMARAGIDYILTRSDLNEATGAFVWLTGSVSGARWNEIATLAVAIAVLVPLAAVVRRPLDMLALGDDTAAGLGVRPTRTRIGVLAIGVGLTAAATAVAGPISFVALIAAPIARRLAPGTALAASALIGAAIVLGADLVAQHAIPGADLPVGAVTAIVGAPYLLWLLAAGSRPRRHRR